MTCPEHVMTIEAGPGPLCGDQAATGSPATPGGRQDAGLSDNAQGKQAVGAGVERAIPAPCLPLIESAPGAGFRADVSEAPTPSGAALTGDCDRQALAGAPRAGALSIGGTHGPTGVAPRADVARLGARAEHANLGQGRCPMALLAPFIRRRR